MAVMMKMHLKELITRIGVSLDPRSWDRGGEIRTLHQPLRGRSQVGLLKAKPRRSARCLSFHSRYAGG